MSKIILAVVLLNTLVSFASLYFSYSVRSQGSDTVVGTLFEPVESGVDARAPTKAVNLEEVVFHPVNKIIVSISGEAREHYFVLDLALYGAGKTNPKDLEKIEPLVRNSVVSALSAKNFQQLRKQSIAELQNELQQVLRHDFASLGVPRPFSQVLVSKLVVQ